MFRPTGYEPKYGRPAMLDSSGMKFVNQLKLNIKDYDPDRSATWGKNVLDCIQRVGYEELLEPSEENFVRVSKKDYENIFRKRNVNAVEQLKREMGGSDFITYIYSRSVQ